MKRHTYEDGAVLDLDDDVDLDELPEGEDDMDDETFAQLVADAEAREEAEAPAPESVEDTPDGVKPEDL